MHAHVSKNCDRRAPKTRTSAQILYWVSILRFFCLLKSLSNSPPPFPETHNCTRGCVCEWMWMHGCWIFSNFFHIHGIYTSSFRIFHDEINPPGFSFVRCICHWYHMHLLFTLPLSLLIFWYGARFYIYTIQLCVCAFLEKNLEHRLRHCYYFLKNQSAENVWWRWSKQYRWIIDFFVVHLLVEWDGRPHFFLWTIDSNRVLFLHLNVGCQTMFGGVKCASVQDCVLVLIILFLNLDCTFRSCDFVFVVSDTTINYWNSNIPWNKMWNGCFSIFEESK